MGPVKGLEVGAIDLSKNHIDCNTISNDLIIISRLSITTFRQMISKGLSAR